MKPLTSIEKRDLLAAEKYDENIVRGYADEFFEQARYGDAFEFYCKLGDAGAVRRLKEAAVKQGDPDLLWRIEHQDRAIVSKQDWADCGESALGLGKFRSAAYVFSRIGDEERLAAAESNFKDPQEASQSPQ